MNITKTFKIERRDWKGMREYEMRLSTGVRVGVMILLMI